MVDTISCLLPHNINQGLPEAGKLVFNPLKEPIPRLSDCFRTCIACVIKVNIKHLSLQGCLYYT